MKKLAEANGFIVKVGYSQYHVFPQVYKTGARAEEEHGEKTVDNYWLEGVNPQRKARFTATYPDGSFDSGTWWGSYVTVNSTNLKKLIKGELNEVPIKKYVKKEERGYGS